MDCKHEKINEVARAVSGPFTAIVQSCGECKAERRRTIVSLKIPGMTCFSDDAGPWVGIGDPQEGAKS